MGPVRAAVFGLGPIGTEALGRLLDDPAFHVCGAADPDAGKCGRDAGALAGRAGRGPVVAADPLDVLKEAHPDVVFLTTGSRASDVAPLAATCLRAGLTVVASSEELAEPRLHPEEEGMLARAAAAGGGRFVSTGVNPGFVLDYLPAVLATATLGVSRIEGRRVVDSLTRRPQLRRKTGAGLRVEDFAATASGHVGLAESAALVARALGLSGEVRESLEPWIAPEALATPEGEIAAGRVAGVRQVASALGAGGREVVRLELVIAAGAPSPADSIRIVGTPPIEVTIPGGFQGERATVARLIAAVRPLMALPPGVYTVLELAPVAFCTE